MNAPTGEQFEITAGAARAVVTERGATLRAYEVAGLPYTETFAADAEPPLGCGNILVPWPNRTASASWTYDGQRERLDVTEPQRGNAIHGLVRKRPWDVVSAETDTITLGIDIEAQQGWPVPLRTEVTYRVAEQGLAVTHTVRNIGSQRVPFGLGTHPYLCAGNRDNDECVLELPVGQRLPLDPASMIPSGSPQPMSALGGHTVAELRSERPLDDPFTAVTRDGDGYARYRLVHPDGGGVELWADEAFGWVQAFTPPEFAGRTGAVAIEPMTCPPDALNSGTDLVWLEPGQEWRGSWGIEPLAATVRPRE